MPFQIPISDALASRDHTDDIAESPAASINHLSDEPAELGNIRPARDQIAGDKRREQQVDLLSFVAAAFSYNLPIIELQLPTGLSPQPNAPSKNYGSYAIGIGRTSFLEPHELKDGELQSLQKQGHAISDRIVALKMSVSPTKDFGGLRAFRQELRVLNQFQLKVHENIVKGLFVGFDRLHKPIIGLEMAAFGTLDDVLLSRSLDGDPSGRLAFDLILDIAAGLAAIHACVIAHGDIKPANVLVYPHPERKVIGRIADFADSVFLQDLLKEQWRPMGGTHSWRAPECYSTSVIYDPFKTDIYSFGLCSLAVLARGGSHSEGAPNECFLERIKWGWGSMSLPTFKQMRGNPAIGAANGWIDRNSNNEHTKTLGKLIALSCLNRQQERRMDSSSLLDLIQMSSLNQNEGSRRLVSMKQSRGKMDQLKKWASEQVDIESFSSVDGLDLMNPFDDRFENLHPFFHSMLFEELDVIASPLVRAKFPSVDETFLDQEFTFQQLEKAFELSLQTSCPRGCDVWTFTRARKAADILAILLMKDQTNLSSTDIDGTISRLLKYLSRSARCGDKQSVLLYLHVLPHAKSSMELGVSVPKRLWLCWSSLKGCRKACNILEKEDCRLGQRISEMVKIRHAPLANRHDATAFVRQRFSDFSLHDSGNPDQMTGTGNSILHLAICNDNLPLVQELLEEEQCDINFATHPDVHFDVGVGEGGETPIMLAARFGNEEIFRYLLKRNPDLSHISQYNCNVLHSLTWFPDKLAAEFSPILVAHGADICLMAREFPLRGVYNPLTHTHLAGSPLAWAVSLGYLEMARCLIDLHQKRGQKVQDYIATVKIAASLFDHMILESLLDHSETLDRSGKRLDHSELDQLLQHSICNPLNIEHISRHGTNVQQAQVNTVKILLQKGARPRSNGTRAERSPVSSRGVLCEIASNGTAEVFELVLQHLEREGKDVRAILKDSQTFAGRDAIQCAIYSNNQVTFEYLMSFVDKGQLDVSFTSDEGVTALHAVSFQKETQYFLKSLLDRGCNPHVRSKDGRTPFLFALMNGNFVGANTIVNHPSCDRNRLLQEPSEKGFMLFGSAVSMALTNYRNRIGVAEIEFMEKMGVVNYISNAETKQTILHLLAHRWPSARSDYANFEIWLLDWLLARMSRDLVNQHDMYGRTALQWMAIQGNDHGIATMLHNSKVDIYCRTVEKGLEIPRGYTTFDIFLTRCRQNPPIRGRHGGARELLIFLERMQRIASLLLPTDIPIVSYPDEPRGNLVRRTLDDLDTIIKRFSSSQMFSEHESEGDVLFSSTFWPRVIPMSSNRPERNVNTESRKTSFKVDVEMVGAADL